MRRLAIALALLGCTAAPAQAAPGSLDHTFGGDGLVHAAADSTDLASAVAFAPDGNIVVGGYADVSPTGDGRTDPGNLDLAVARFTHDGRLATRATLDAGGHEEASAMAVEADGSLLLAGWSRSRPNETFQSQYSALVARFRADGRPDPSFGQDGAVLLPLAPTPYFGAELVHRHRDGRITIAGPLMSPTGSYSLLFARLLPDGRPDATFGPGGVRSISFHGGATATAFALDDAGRVVVVGIDPPPGLDQPSALVVQRFSLGGTLDQSFGSHGTATIGSGTHWPEAIAFQSAGTIVVGHPTGQYGETGRLVRLGPNGAPDPTLGTGGGVATITPSSVVVDRADRIVVGGPGFAMRRYGANGAPDGVFRPAAIPQAYQNTHGVAVTLAPDGDLVAAGWMQAREIVAFEAPYYDFGVARFHGGSDSTSPRLYVRARTRGCVRAVLKVRLRARDDSGVAALAVRVDGRVVARRRGGRAALRVSTRRLGRGPHRLAVTAVDRVENRTVQTLGFRRCR